MEKFNFLLDSIIGLVEKQAILPILFICGGLLVDIAKGFFSGILFPCLLRTILKRRKELQPTVFWLELSPLGGIRS
jgi:hypothetical protein